MIFVVILGAIFGVIGLIVAFAMQQRAKNLLERVKMLDSANKVGESA